MKTNNTLQLEIRSFRATELRVAPEGDGNTLTGYIAVTNQPTEMFPGYVETLKRGCFTRTLAADAGNDVVALINHDPDAPVGRLSAGTLTQTKTLRVCASRSIFPTPPAPMTSRSVWNVGM